MTKSAAICSTFIPIEATQVLDVDGTLVRLGGDRSLFSEIAGYLLEDAPPLFQALCRAVEAKDSAAVHMRAHALKGLLAGCGGLRAARVAQELECSGEAADLSRADLLMAALQHELDLLVKALTPFLQECSQHAQSKTRQGSDGADRE